MSIIQIISKLEKGEILSESEKSELEKFRKDYNPSKSTDSAEIQRLKAESKAKDDELSAKTAELETLKTEKMTAEEKSKHETDKARKAQEATLAAEKKARETAETELATLRRGNAVSGIADKHKFLDKEYLNHVLNAKGILLEDENAVKTFMETLSKESPHLFISDVKTGGGTAPSAGIGVTGKARFDEIMAKTAPSQAELSEAMKFANESVEAAKA